MATYEFRAGDGSVIERDYPMCKAPPLGRVVRANGKVYRRIMSLPRIAVEHIDCVSMSMPFLSDAQMRDASVPSPTIGSDPSTGNGKFPPSVVEVAVIHDDKRGRGPNTGTAASSETADARRPS